MGILLFITEKTLDQEIFETGDVLEEDVRFEVCSVMQEGRCASGRVCIALGRQHVEYGGRLGCKCALVVQQIQREVCRCHCDW